MHSSCSPPGLVVALLPRSLARSLSSSRADAPARRDVVQRLRNAWNAAALRMRVSYLTRNRRTAGSVMSLDDDLTIVCGDLTETCGPRSLPPFLSFVRSPCRLSSFSLPVAETSKFLMRSVRRQRSSLLHCPRQHLLYFTLPVVATRRRLILFAAYRDTRGTRSTSPHLSSSLSFSFRLGLMRAN